MGNILTPKQREYIEKATHRWNIKTGATRSGKTWLDLHYTIPARLLNVRGKEGLDVFLGNTKGTLQRNVIEPMQEFFGADRVSSIRSDNTATVFGERVYCLGADNKKHVDRIRGSSIKYCYGDEIVTWNADVFDMLKSRMDKPYSRFDGTCNPEGPKHWFKAFLDSGLDIYQQHYRIDDNPHLSPAFIENLKREYAGTVYYPRYIDGLWVAAEGAIYRPFVDKPDRFLLDAPPPVSCAVIGVDFGGGTSAHAFSCVGYTPGMRKLVVLDEWYCKDALDPERLASAFVDFVRACKSRWLVADAYCDSAEQTLIRGLRTAAARARVGINIVGALKRPINDRIRTLCILMASDRFGVVKTCAHTIDALHSAVWDSRNPTQDVRLDDGSINIDSLDAMEYAYERQIPALIDRGLTT